MGHFSAVAACFLFSLTQRSEESFNPVNLSWTQDSIATVDIKHALEHFIPFNCMYICYLAEFLARLFDFFHS